MACASPDDLNSSHYTNDVENGIRLSALLINEGTSAVRRIFVATLQDKQTTLVNILNKPGTKQDETDSWKENTLSQKDAIMYQQQLTNLLENDLPDIQAMLKLFQRELSENRECFEGHLSNVDDSLKELRSESNDQLNDLQFQTANMLDILSTLPREITNVLLTNIHSVKFNMKKWMEEIKKEQRHQTELITKQAKAENESLEDIREKVTSVMETQAKGNTSIERQMSSITLLKEKVIQVYQRVSDMDEIKSASVQKIHKLLQDSTGAFKILLFNKPEALQSYDSTNELCFALGSVPWDIIIDFDHDSRTLGIFDKIAKVLAKQKDFKVSLYTEMSRISDDDKEMVAKGMKTLWLLANGCSSIGCDSVEKQIGIILAKIYPLFEGILTRLHTVKPLVLVNLIMSEQAAWPVSSIVQAFTHTCENVKERIEYEESSILSIVFEESHLKIVPNTVGDIQHSKCELTPAQLLYVLLECFPSDHEEKRYYYPGDKGTMCFISADEMAKVRPYMELYHTKIGEVDFTGKSESEVEQYVDDIKLDFLKGYALTPEALYVNDTCSQIYVARTEMRAVKEVIEKRLDEREQWFKKSERLYHGYFEILHDASGSGTTTAIYLLYQMRNQYPCLLIKKIDEKTVSFLRKFSHDSRKPLLLLIDSPEYKSNDVLTLQYWLENEIIKSVLVHVRRVVLNDDQREELRKSVVSNGKCYISSVIESEPDKLAFRKLYNAVKSSIKADRVYLFGLIAFCQDYARLNTHIEACLQNMTQQQKYILSLVFLIWEFSHVPVSISLLKNLVEKSNKKKTLDTLLGFGCDLVVVQRLESSIRPAHQCLLEPMHKILEKVHNRRVIMTTFMDNLYKMFSATQASKEDSLYICHELFIQRQNPKEDFFSSMVKELEKCCGDEYVAEQILRFISLYQGITKENHLRGLYARYLMYQINKPDEAIKQIVMAVGLQTTQSIGMSRGINESGSLLTAYAGLFRQYAKYNYQKHMKEADASTALHEAIPKFEESVRAYKLAQQVKKSYSYSQRSYTHVSKYTPHPFIGEAKARYDLLKLCFYNSCDGIHEKFHSFINTTQRPFLKESEKEAMDALQKIDLLISIDNLYDEEPALTKTTILETKFRLLTLRYDKDMTVTKILKRIPNDVPCDVGLLVRLRIATLRFKPGCFAQCSWEDLTAEQLQLIIETILRRIADNCMLSNNYKDAITAMIYLRHIKGRGKYRQYNIDLAIQIAREWVDSSSYELYAQYMLGVLLFTKAIDENKENLAKEAVDVLEKVHEASFVQIY